MTARLDRSCAALVLLLWAGVLGYFVLSSRIASYLHPSFHRWTAFSAVVLGLCGVVLLLTRPLHGGCCHHDNRLLRGGLLPAALLTLPLVLATWISPSRFGEQTILNRGLVADAGSLPGYQPPLHDLLPGESPAEGTMMDPSRYLRQNAEGWTEAETVDLLYAASDEAMRGDFDGRNVEIRGQFLPARDGVEGRFRMVRLFVMCCAADARPVAIDIESPSADFPKMAWVRARGKVEFPLEGGRRVPLLRADSVEEIEPPAESFIY